MRAVAFRGGRPLSFRAAVHRRPHRRAGPLCTAARIAAPASGGRIRGPFDIHHTMVWSTSKDSGAWALVETQHGVVARRQLLELGFSSRAIDHRVAKRQLRPLYRGVYLVGRPGLTQHGRWMAAALACGTRAALSHHSAAALWQIRPPSPAHHVSAPLDHRRPGIVIHRRALGEDQTTRHHNIPVTSPACTVVDIAPALSRSELEGAVSEADKLGLIDPEALRVALEQMPQRPGVPKLRDTLDRHTYVMTDRARAALPSHRPPRRPAATTHADVRERLPRRLLLARARARRRD
jgi:hypothetical protein